MEVKNRDIMMMNMDMNL